MKILDKIEKSLLTGGACLFALSLLVTLFDSDYVGKFASNNMDAEMIKMGEILYQQKNCVGCHGEKGKSPQAKIYPKLNGQSTDYIALQLKDILEGRRTNGLSAVMKNSVLGGLKPEEIKAIAKYLESQ